MYKKISSAIMLILFLTVWVNPALSIVSPPTGLKILKITPPFFTFSIENLVIDPTGKGVATLYLKTIKPVAGLGAFLVFDGNKIALSQPEASAKSNALAGLFDANLNTALMLENFAVSNPDNQAIVADLAATGKNVALLVAIDANAKTGKIPICELSFTAQVGQTTLTVVANGVYNGSGVPFEFPPQNLIIAITR